MTIFDDKGEREDLLNAEPSSRQFVGDTQLRKGKGGKKHTQAAISDGLNVSQTFISTHSPTYLAPEADIRRS